MLLTGGGLVLLILLYFFGKTVSPAKSDTAKTNVAPVNQVVKFDDLLVKAKEHISAEQNARLTALENAVIRGDVKEQQIHVYHQLARFWADSAHIFEPYAWYTGQAAKLENSEKSLTFAAHLYLDNLITEGEPAIQTWLATNAKDLLEKALAINPGNDSSKIGLGACYMFGNISDNPMQGIMPVREIVEKHPENLYGQKILGLGGRKSGQYDKAIDRFKIILQYEPKNVEAILNIAECYELKGDKKEAAAWYGKARDLIAIPEAKTALNKRIEELKH